MASGNIQETLDIYFKSLVKPTKIIVKQPNEQENMSRKIQVFLNEEDFETLDCIQDEAPQTFKLKKTTTLNHIKLSIENTFGGKNAGGQFKIMGVRCDDPNAKKQAEAKKQLDALAIKEKLKPQVKSCTDSMDNMVSDKSIVVCLPGCTVNENDVTKVGEQNYTMDSAVCTAAKLFYEGKDEANGKNFGVIRVKNDKKINGETPPYVYTFDSSLTKPTMTYKANEEVDVLDEKECFIRAKVNNVKGNIASISYKGENRSYSLDKVFKCGDKLPFIKCAEPSTNPIRIKFAPHHAVKILRKKNIGNFKYDSGHLAKKHKSF